MNLDMIRKEYLEALEFPKMQKNKKLIALMNSLERIFATFIIHPTDSDLEHEAVQLYQEISSAREF